MRKPRPKTTTRNYGQMRKMFYGRQQSKRKQQRKPIKNPRKQHRRQMENERENTKMNEEKVDISDLPETDKRMIKEIIQRQK